MGLGRRSAARSPARSAGGVSMTVRLRGPSWARVDVAEDVLMPAWEEASGYLYVLVSLQ